MVGTTVDRVGGDPTRLARTYERPLVKSYGFTLHDFGAGAAAFAIRRAANTRFASILDIELAEITETFTATTTSAFVRIGTAADADKFAEFDCALAAATDARSVEDDTDAIKAAGELIDMDNDGDAAASLAQLEVTFVAPTGGTPAGIAVPIITIAWWK